MYIKFVRAFNYFKDPAIQDRLDEAARKAGMPE